MAVSNYDITLSRMPAEFLKYDQQRMLRQFAPEYDARYLYLPFLGRRYRVGRRNGLVHWLDQAGQWQLGGYSDAMTLYDLLCCAKEGARLSGRFCRPSQLRGTLYGADPAAAMGGAFARFCDEHPEALRRALVALGGEDLHTGEISYRVPVFPFFPAVVQFWASDEDFPASLKFMWDENALDFLKYETICFAEGFLMERLREEMKKFT